MMKLKALNQNNKKLNGVPKESTCSFLYLNKRMMLESVKCSAVLEQTVSEMLSVKLNLFVLTCGHLLLLSDTICCKRAITRNETLNGSLLRDVEQTSTVTSYLANLIFTSSDCFLLKTLNCRTDRKALCCFLQQR